MRATRHFITAATAAILALGAFGPAAVRPAYAAANLLANPGFEEGWYHWNLTPELAVPNGWDFWWADSGVPKLVPQDQEWGRPESVTWLYPPGFAETYFWRDGQYTLKVFGAWHPIWFRISQTVSGLTPGASYRFTAPIWPETVASWDPKVYAGEANAGEFRLVARSGGQTFDSGWMDQSSVPPGQWNLLNLDFQPPGSSVTVEVEVRGRWGLINNAYFIDQLSLQQVGAVTQPTATATATGTDAPTSAPPAATTAPPTATTTTSSPTSNTSPAPTNTTAPAVAQAPASSSSGAPASSSIPYTVQRGDTLWRISRDHGVSMDAIAALNGITNYALVFTGTTLQIPIAGSAPSSGSSGASSTTTTTTTSSTSSSAPSTTTASSGAVTTYVVQRGDSLVIIARKFGLTPTVLATTNGLNNINLIYVGQTLTIPERSRYYTVQAGDALASIAARVGVAMEDLVSANRLRDPNLIYRGQVLVIP